MLAVVSMALVSCGGGNNDKQQPKENKQVAETPTPDTYTETVKDSEVLDEPLETEENETAAPQFVVVDATDLRLRFGPSLEADTYKKLDGKNEHVNKGECFPYLGEEGDFYKIDYHGQELWVAKEFTYLSDTYVTMAVTGDNDDDDFSIADSADWDKILDEYEQYVNKYYSFAEKVSKGNASAMTDALSMAEKAASLAEKLDRADDNLSTAQMNRLLKIQNKMAQAATKMAGAASNVEDMMNDLENMNIEDLLKNMPEIPDFWSWILGDCCSQKLQYPDEFKVVEVYSSSSWTLKTRQPKAISKNRFERTERWCNEYTPYGRTLIEKTECPKGDFSEDGWFDVVGSYVSIGLPFYLAKAFVLAAHLYDDVTINSEVSLLESGIFHHMARRSQLIGKERLAGSPYLFG